MEKFRRRSQARARVLCHSQENQRIGKENSSTVLGSDSSSYSCGTSAEIELFDQGKISSSLPTGTPMKKLLADEMSRETESKRRSPSVIARLMGLDGLPSHHNCNKPRKKNADEHHQDSGSAGCRQSSRHYDSQSQRKSLKGHQQFKDVYEVVECSNRKTRNSSSHVASDRNPSEDKVAFIRQKFMDVKRFSTDEKLRNSKQFHDALEVLDSNKDILLKFLQEPDSLFLKHLYELRGAALESHWELFSKMKSTNTLKNSTDAFGNRSGRKAVLNNDTSHCHKRSSSCNGNLYHRRNLDFQKSILLEEGMEVTSIPTRIVVLKPNLGKLQTTSGSAFSSSSSHVEVSNADVCSEYSSKMHAGSKMGHKCHAHREFDINDRRSQESRELAREITRRMRHNLELDSSSISSFGYYGYSADESGQDMSENDSSYDSEWPTIGSRPSPNRTILKKASTSHYAESHVNREAKRRLSERWKMTRRSHLLGGSSKGSTLAEMLSIPDVDIRPRGSNAVAIQDECFLRVGCHAKTAQSDGPLGISTRDGWKDGYVHNLSRSRSLPPSNHLGSPKSCRSREVLDAERFRLRKEGVRHLINLPLKKGCEREDVSSMPSETPSYRKSKRFNHPSTEVINSAQEIKWSRGMMTESLDEKDSFELKGDILDMSSSRQDTISPLHTVADENINVFEPESCPDQQIPVPGKSSDILSRENSSAHDSPPVPQEPSTTSYVSRSACLLDTATQPESPVSSKESEQPSPVSVLETPFVEELSSGSECFERVSADLHGLRMQLQLLKLESEAYDGGSTLTSSDDDVELSNKLPDHKELVGVGESWESSYLLHVLTESNLDITNPEFFLSTWHMPDCPISFVVFETLEKKYIVWETCSRSDRRFLFDCINSKIVEISWQHLNLYPWVKQQRKNISGQWWENQWFETELQKLLEREQEHMSDNTTDAVMLDTMPWLELGVHIDSIGRDIEGLLMDDLVGELVAFK